MDALIKDLNANEAARLLILLDDRLTTLINAAVSDREPKPVRPPPAAEVTLEAARPVPPSVETPAKPPDVRPAPEPPIAAEPPKRAEPLLPLAEPQPPPRDMRAAAATTIPSTPILAVPEQPPDARAPQREPRPLSFEEAFASVGKPEAAAAPKDETEAVPVEKREAAPAASLEPPRAAVVPLPVPPPPPRPAAEPARLAEEGDEESDLVEEDLEDGEDLKEALDRQPKRGLSGLFSKFRLPGFSRRRDEAPPPDEIIDEDLPPDDDDLLSEDEDPSFDDDLDDEPDAPRDAFDRNLRRLHDAVDQLGSNHLLGEAAERTGNRIELRKVDAGLDLIVKGLPKPLGTVRLTEDEGCAVYQPKFGLDLPSRQPNRADLEIWMKAMDDVVVRVLEDIATRRRGGGGSTAGNSSGAP